MRSFTRKRNHTKNVLRATDPMTTVYAKAAWLGGFKKFGMTPYGGFATGIFKLGKAIS
jgi:hypothetical protein